MAIRRIMPYHESPDFEATRAFYTGVLGLEEVGSGGGYIGSGSGQAHVLSAPLGAEPAPPDMGVDVDRREAVDAATPKQSGAEHDSSIARTTSLGCPLFLRPRSAGRRDQRAGARLRRERRQPIFSASSTMIPSGPRT